MASAGTPYLTATRSIAAPCSAAIGVNSYKKPKPTVDQLLPSSIALSSVAAALNRLDIRVVDSLISAGVLLNNTAGLRTAVVSIACVVNSFSLARTSLTLLILSSPYILLRVATLSSVC